MQIVGFNLTKMMAEKSLPFKKANIINDISFTEVEKAQLDLLNKESEALKISFLYTLKYEDPAKKDNQLAKLLFEGFLVLSMAKEETKEIIKSWKKKQLPPNVHIALFNAILHKCTTRAVYMQDEIALPSHLPMPRLNPKQEN